MMRAKCLLESYYGERMLTATAQCFSDCTSDEFICQASPQHVERSLQSDEFSGGSYYHEALPQHVERSLQSDEFSGGSYYHEALNGANLLPMIENDERNDPQNVRQMQAIRALGANLRRAADCMQIKPARSISDVNPTALLEEGLSNEEIQVVRKIYAETASTTISNIAKHLQECLTSQTFRMALAFLSSSTSSVPEELAAACELARLIYPRVREAMQAGPIYGELQEFIEAKLDEVLL